MKAYTRFLAAGVLAGGVLLGAAPAKAAPHGCVPTEPDVPVENELAGDPTCQFVITPGGAYNGNMAAQTWSITVRNTRGEVVKSLPGAGPSRVAVLTEGEASSLAGGTITVSVKSGTAVVGCATCDAPA